MPKLKQGDKVKIVGKIGHKMDKHWNRDRELFLNTVSYITRKVITGGDNNWIWFQLNCDFKEWFHTSWLEKVED